MTEQIEKDLDDFLTFSDFIANDSKIAVIDTSISIARFTRELSRRTNVYIEMMAAAFIKESGIPASECELVVEWGMGKVRYYFRKRAGHG